MNQAMRSQQNGGGQPAQAPNNGEANGGTLGTFGGVFTPSILTILGLVLFLRVAFVVGSVGLVRALIILALATSVAVLTSLSLATVATNMKVRGGGEYFLISRTLGIEFGGAVGVVLYLAISVSIAFYSIGFAEALVAALGFESSLLVQLVAAGLVLVLTGIGFVGSDLATRLQYLVMVLLILALVSFFIGAVSRFDSGLLSDNLGQPSDNLGQPDDAKVGFWEAFAIFFPAVTGFSQGVAMSGDLKTPSRSITRGTFAAVGLSTVVYLAAIVLLAGGATSAVLAADTTTIMGEFSWLGWTMLVGVLAATLSSALASTLGGPRVLQKLGEDKVLPRLDFFAAGFGMANNPRRALFVSTGLALLTVAAGDLNAIAPVISMFFLASYGIINYATYFEIRAGSTAFRPSFRWYDRRASLAGTIACAGAIVAINPLAGALAATVFVALYNYLSQRDMPDRWVDSSGSHHYTQARAHLRSLADEPVGTRDWRPCILAFVPRDPVIRGRMIRMSSWIEGDSGYLTAVRMVEGSGPVLRRQAAAIEEDLAAEVDALVPGASARVLLVGDADSGVQSLIQSHGLGPIRPNTTVFGVRGLRGTDDNQRTYSQMLRNCVRFGTNVAVISVRDDAWERFESTPKNERSIALWWSDDQAGQLITLLGWLCQRHSDWEESSIVVHVTREEGELERIRGVLDDARIEASVHEVEPTPAALVDALGSATLAFAPLRVRRGVALGPFETPLGMLVESLPLAVMTLVSESVDLDAEADDEDLVELEKLTEQTEAARRRADELDAEAASLLVHAEALRIELADLKAGSENGDHSELEAELNETQNGASDAYRTYIDARARCVALESKLADLGPGADAADVDPDVWRSSVARQLDP